MDSRNSGSMQSSSGDEEYDSRAESSISAFLNNHPPSHVGHFTTQPQPPPPPPPHQLHTHMLDPLSNYLDPIQRSPSLVNLDVVWSKPGSGRSEPNPVDLGSLIPCSSSSTPTQNNQELFSSQFTTESASFSTVLHHSLPPESASRGLLSVSASINDQAHNTNNNASAAAATINNNVVRNPKKRSRASRRAPTTVLTTDTTNFRAMVQEFTGIPAPPFTSSPFPRSRLDLFGSAATSTIRSPHLELPPPPPYLLRPFAQKVQPPIPFVPPPSSSFPSFPTASSLMDNGTVAANSTNSSTKSTSINYQLSSDLGLFKQPPQNFLNVNVHSTPILSFQSILKYPLENSSIPQTTDNSHLKMGALDEFGLSHANAAGAASGLHNMFSPSTSSDGALCRAHITTNPSSNWAEGRGTDNDGDHGVSTDLSGNYNNTERAATTGKVSYPASSSDFHGDKGSERVAARSEGMVESWINCSSD